MFADKDGRDKIITVTIINESGGRTQFQVRDKKVFDYSGPENTERGPKFYKYNIVQEITIDLRNHAITVTNPEREAGTFKEISVWEYTKVGGAIIDFFSKKRSGDNSNKEQVGWRLYGAGKDMEWQSGLPKPAEGSDPDGIDIKSILEFALDHSSNESPAEIYNAVVKRYMKNTGKDMKQLLYALNLMASMTENFVELTENIQESIDKTKELVEKFRKNSESRLDPGNERKRYFPTKNKEDICPTCKLKKDSAHVNKQVKIQNGEQ